MSWVLKRRILASCGIAAAILAAGGMANAVGICGTESVFLDLAGIEPLPFGGEVIGVTTLQGEVVHARIDVSFTAPKGYDASLVSFTLQLPNGFFGISGSRLGWSGSGTFTASIETDDLNGPIVPPAGTPFATWLFFPASGGQTGGVFETLTYTFQWGQCPIGDLTHDGDVNSLDLRVLLSSWSIPASSPGCGAPGKDCPADLNGDGHVNSLDLGILLSHWGPFCPLCQ